MKTQLRNLLILVPMSMTLINCAKTEFRVFDEAEVASQAVNGDAQIPVIDLGGLPSGDGDETTVVREPTSTPPGPQNPGTTTPVPTPTPNTSSSTYRWSAGAYGACSAQSQVSVGAWSECENLSCNGGEQKRAVSCTPRSGVQSRSVTCVRGDGLIVADQHCQGLKPSTTVACSSTCDTTAYPTRQACVKGTPCRFSFTTQYLVSDANNPHRNHSKCSALAHVKTGLHGDRCYNPYKKGVAGGDVKAVAFNGGNGVDTTTWNLKHPGDCRQGYGVEIQNVYSCLGVCKSGQWVEVDNAIGDSKVNPLTGDLESPLSNPWAHPENSIEVAGRRLPHYRCVGQE
ncbi:MAG: hypothetical protein KF767_18855 [Bdellovibrionaceae bacterium]|nr:hypothetical protein [Pseudobdellovibrionaceae bacterium]